MALKKSGLIKFLAAIIFMVAGIVICFNFIFASLVGDMFGPAPLSQVAFDSKKWSKNEDGEKNERYRMIQSLEKSHLRVGMTRESVQLLLGTPFITSDKHSEGWWICTGKFDVYGIRFYYNLIDYDTDYFILQYDEGDLLQSWKVATMPG